MPANTTTGRAVAAIQEDGRESLSDPAIVRQYGSAAEKSVHIDHLTFSDEDRAACGVSDEEVLVFPARNEATGWAGKRRFEQIRRKYGQARHVVYTDGPMKGRDPYEHSHNMAVAVPREAFNRVEAERAQRGREYISKFRPADADQNEFEMEVDVFEKTAENYRRRRRANAEMFRHMKIGEGSPTSRMSFEEGLAYLERRGVDLERLETQARRGGRHIEDSQSNWRRLMGGKTTIVSGFGKEVNPNSALGQVQQRAAREAAKR